MIIAIGVLSSRRALAQPADLPPPATPAAPAQLAGSVSETQVATTAGYFAQIVPTLKVSASTSGKSDFQIGIDILHGFPNNWDLHVLPSLHASTESGASNLFSFSNGKLSGGAPWTLGATVALSKLPAAPDLSHRMANNKATRAAVRASVEICLAQCNAGTMPSDEKTFSCKAYQGKSPDDLTNLSPDKLCAEGKKAYKSSRAENDAREARLFPQWDISAGMELGLSEMQYLMEQPGNDLNQSKMYTEASHARPSVTGAFALTYVEQSPEHGLTFELPLSAGHRWDAQQKMGHYCPSSGSVGDAAIVTCDDRPVGTPDENFVGNAALLLGLADTDHGYWRIAAGPVVNYKSTHSEVHAGIEIPLYLNTTSLITDKSQYQGVIRLTPTFGMSHDSKNGRAFEAVLTIDLLGQRNLFSRALDWKH